MPSSRCLFRLVPSEPPTDETGCSSSQGVLLQTPTTVQTDEPPEKMRAEKNGYKNGTKFGSLTSQIKYDERLSPIRQKMFPYVNRNGLFATPQTSDKEDPLTDEQLEKYVAKYEKKGVMPSCAYQLRQAAVMNMLPTPTAIEGVKWTNTWNPNSQMGQNLSAMAGSGMLPTPQARDHKQDIVDEKLAKRLETHQKGLPEVIADSYVKTTKSETAGKTSRLSPLFTEEMMGFPLMWTALPFLSESGASKPSKPTATPSSPK